MFGRNVEAGLKKKKIYKLKEQLIGCLYRYFL